MPTLAERLGHDADARLLIINCDDLGSLHGANLSIFEALRDGGATSASLMVPCPWAADAAIRALPDDDIGVHLTVTSEWDGYRWGPLTDAPVLRAADGRMHRTTDECHRRVVDAGRIGLAQLRAECRAQIEQALAWGIDITHLDAHMGTMQLDPVFVDVYLDLATEYDVPVRMASARSTDAAEPLGRAEARSRGLLHPDWFVSTYLDARPILERVVASLRPGVTEILLHPCLDSIELRAACRDADERVANHEFASVDRGLPTLAAEHGATLIGFRGLRDAMRAT